ncbi:hypothetical protein DV704_04570 [Meiothermus sp. QL-1]|uniref:YIP1 family protein n=1 Tax=Meiothermus sp. QL-1 TaxID=2058095 RepID=UPI000E0C53D2|nr:YIP1 family protein [Meiothermus sp. QL-1]RDI96189.1 hypothetical protein DV704_04570 [Meiothermus sp. QL-1]
MWEVLIRPAQFFRALSARKPELTAPFLIVLAASVLASAGSALSLRLLPSPLGGFALQLGLGLLGGVVGGIVLFGLGGLIIRLLAGPDSRAWEVYGWASAPGVLLGLFLLPLAALLPLPPELPPPPLTDPEALQAWQRELQRTVAQAPFTRLQQGLGFLGLAWSLGIVWAGLRVLAPQRALLAVGVLGVASLGLSLWSLGWV